MNKENITKKGEKLERLLAAADIFRHPGHVIDIREYGNGNVNDTFLVTLDTAEHQHFILQRINTEVFRQPHAVMRNMRIVTEHIGKRLQLVQVKPGRIWRVSKVFLTRDCMDHWTDPDGSFWRAISFIEGAQSFETIQSIEHAREVGSALGLFHSLISDIPCESLADTLVGFHITPLYLQRYDELLTKIDLKKLSEIDYCTRFVSSRRAWVPILEHAKEQGKLALRPIHGDPKVNNVMMDKASGQAVSLIDLDTVKPGLIHYDIGDCLRSCCNPLGEETEQWEAVRFELDYCRAILDGYFSEARDFLSKNDCDYLYDAIRLIAFELGLRFFTDHLEGNAYFKANNPEHNLQRALVQFKLARSIELQEKQIRTVLQDMR